MLNGGINPSLTSENEETVTPATISQNILVIGGGPAGLEAAYILSKRGHKVTLAERHHTLGGAMIVAVILLLNSTLLKLLNISLNE